MTTVEHMEKALKRYQGTPAALRDVMQLSTMALGVALLNRKDALEVKVRQRWAWIDQHNTVDLTAWTVEKHSPQFDEREDALIADIREIERIEDVLRKAQRVLFNEAA